MREPFFSIRDGDELVIHDLSRDAIRAVPASSDRNPKSVFALPSPVMAWT